jgi:transcriptional regulator with XRE-family HTH domain
VPNERLRDALLRKGLTPEQAATAINVDTKTVERWITKGRTPYPKHRHALAALLRESEVFLWPDALPPERAAEVATSEVVTVYPHRHAIPRDLWQRLVANATTEVDILVYAGLFLTDDPALIKSFRAKAQAGAKIRVLFGDPRSREVIKRSTEENIGASTITAKIRNVLAFFRPLAEEPGIDIRLHKTTLYNSIYRFDDDMLVNTHVYGSMAAHAPVLHLRRLSGGDLFDTYSESFDVVWNESKPATWTA